MRNSVLYILIVLGTLTCCQRPLEVGKFHDGVALASISNSKGEKAYMIINPDSEVVGYIHQTNLLLDKTFHDDRLLYQDMSNNRWGYLDKKGNTAFLLPEDIISAQPFFQGLAIVQGTEGKGIVDKNGNMLIAATFPDVSITADGKILINNGSQWLTPEELAMAEEMPVTTKEVVQPVVQNHVNAQDWKTITTQSPFYEEARKVFAGQLEEQDARNREKILDYVEQLRTSYNTKDIDFIEQVFSDRALIVTGKVVRTSVEDGNRFLSQPQVIYNIRSKQQYVEKLKQIFQANKRIDLQFSDFKIMRHPTLPDIYGVSLRQAYTSDLYSDDGYLFLLWDFQETDAPKIHVRTWQPRILENHAVIPENEIFSLRNFNLQ